MGVSARNNPPLPAPTESTTLPTSSDEIPTDLATDVSRYTDRTSYSIPEDGSPITVRTSGKGNKPLHRANQSNTSLLIEYFEDRKGSNVNSRPSVRVKVTPSAKKGKDTKDHIQVTQTAEGNRKPSYTRRISLGPKDRGETHIIEGSRVETDTVTEGSDLSARGPVEVEILQRDQGSDLSEISPPKENRSMAFNQSEVSSMPPDSMLDEAPEPAAVTRKRSPSFTKIATASTAAAVGAAAVGAAAVVGTLKAPSRARSRSLSRERLTKKVMEKLEAKEAKEARLSSGKHKHSTSSKSRSRSVSKEHLTENLTSPRRRSGKSHRDEPSESSVITGSQVSEARSYRSDASKSSITNPKLLRAVEDSIRRLILPELVALKEQQKLQQEGTRDSYSSTRGGDVSKRVSKVSNDSIRSKSHREDSLKKKHRRHSDRYEDSPSERSFEREKSQETVVHDSGGKHRKRSKEGSHLKDAAAGALVGGLLTHAAMKTHNSGSPVDRKERRRRRDRSDSRSHSISNSAAETEEIFNKHDVPPMPMRSELTNSDVTRDSILSERTSTPSSEKRRTEIRHAARAVPRDVYSPSQTPTRSPSGLRNSTTYNDDYDDEYFESEQSRERGGPHHYVEAALGGAAAGAGLMAARHAYDQHDGAKADRYSPNLSPVQSVASFENRDGLSRENSKRQHATAEHLRERDVNDDRREGTVSMSTEESYLPKNRPQGFSLESPSVVLRGLDNDLDKDEIREHTDEHHIGGNADESWFAGDDGEHYRDSAGADSYDSPRVPVGHLTQYTDDSMDAPYLDKVTAAQEVRGVGANTEWVQTPVAVESAVASLHEPSTLDGYSTKSIRSRTGESYLESPGKDGREEFLREARGITETVPGAGVRVENEKTVSNARSTERSPVQSEQNRESYVEMTGSALPNPNDPMPEIMDVDSEISTNPTDIQGPKKYDTPIQWPYHEATPPQTRAENIMKSNNTSAHDSLASAAKNMLGVTAAAGAAAAVNQHRRKAKDSFENLEGEEARVKDFNADDDLKYGGPNQTGWGYETEYGGLTSPRDEGYATQQEHEREHSAGALTPDNRHRGIKPPDIFADPTGGVGMPAVGVLTAGAYGLDKEDPFTVPDPRRVSGNSHGLNSPLYDAATGYGIDRIQSKDIMALMNHLTVRDGERNARDTEILVTLVQTAAEMRNSFEGMKKFIERQDDMVIAVGNKQHEKTQRVIGGPRPQPARTARRAASADDDSFTENVSSKRRNVFRRALKGLSGKNNSDLSRIEEMLNHLLDEVADLKAAQDIRPTTAFQSRVPGLTSYEQLRDVPLDPQDGYEPEGQAGTSSTPNHSGYFSNPPSGRNSRQQGSDRRRASQNRVSTVMEEREEEDADEPLAQHEEELLQYENTENLLTPTRDLPRGGSAPTEVTPTNPVQREIQSSENTPKTNKDRKSKANTSWFSPKISRWSKTTASSIPEGGRKSLQKERLYSNISHSGSDLPNYDGNEHYDAQGDDRLRSSTSLANEGRPPSPLIPSQVSGVSEKPQYHAHRNSVNLQHPQPRQGPTARFQNHLESQVRDINSPVSPTSDQFGSNPILAARFAGTAGNRNSGMGNLSPISDVGTSSEASAQRKAGPPRPPKIKHDGPLVPPKVPIEGSKPTFVERSAAGRDFSQSNGASLSPPSGKKPGGPRPQTVSGSYQPDRVVSIQKKRFRGSPNAIPAGDGEDETF